MLPGEFESLSENSSKFYMKFSYHFHPKITITSSEKSCEIGSLDGHPNTFQS